MTDNTAAPDWLSNPFAVPTQATPSAPPPTPEHQAVAEHVTLASVDAAPRQPDSWIVARPKTKKTPRPNRAITQNVRLYRDAHVVLDIKVGLPVAVTPDGVTTFVAVVSKIGGGVVYLTFRPAQTPRRVALGTIVAVGNTTVPHPERLPEFLPGERHV